MRFVDLIEKKADGLVLNDEEIRWMIDGYVKGVLPDYQMSAMCMAILQKGMTPEETATLTMAMMHSGDIVDLSDLDGVKVDKHSTGGVGDTTTLVVVPLVAACGATVAKMSGRGLGHTGGTLDKLESIPGTSVEQPIDVFKDIVRKNNAAVVGQTGNLVPADKKIYALRDVTATVRSIPLIASSIMSKKLASGTDAIVLDVKTGTGAFMRNEKDAFELARMMVRIGSLLNKKVSAIVTDMNQPLGMAIGNALEVKEAIEILSGKVKEDAPLYQVSLILASHLLVMSEIAKDTDEAEMMLKEKIRDGSGLKKLQDMIALQGGDPSYVSLDKIDELLQVKKHLSLCAKKAGYVSKMNAEKIGVAAQMMGAGRAKKGDLIDPAVGIVMKVRCGDIVKEGEEMADLYINDETFLDDVICLLYDAITIEETCEGKTPLVYGMITEKDI